jgi:hypothetical protein
VEPAKCIACHKRTRHRPQMAWRGTSHTLCSQHNGRCRHGNCCSGANRGLFYPGRNRCSMVLDVRCWDACWFTGRQRGQRPGWWPPTLAVCPSTSAWQRTISDVVRVWTIAALMPLSKGPIFSGATCQTRRAGRRVSSGEIVRLRDDCHTLVKELLSSYSLGRFLFSLLMRHRKRNA